MRVEHSNKKGIYCNTSNSYFHLCRPIESMEYSYVNTDASPNDSVAEILLFSTVNHIRTGPLSWGFAESSPLYVPLIQIGLL